MMMMMMMIKYLVIFVVHVNCVLQIGVWHTVLQQSRIDADIGIALVESHIGMSLWSLEDGVGAVRSEVIVRKNFIRTPTEVRTAWEGCHVLWGIVSSNDLVFGNCFEDVLRSFDWVDEKMRENNEVEIATTWQSNVVDHVAVFGLLQKKIWK